MAGGSSTPHGIPHGPRFDAAGRQPGLVGADPPPWNAEYGFGLRRPAGPPPASGARSGLSVVAIAGPPGGFRGGLPSALAGTHLGLFCDSASGFARRVVIGPRLQIPADLPRSGIEQYRQQVEAVLLRLTWEAEAWAEAGSRKRNQVAAYPGSASGRPAVRLPDRQRGTAERPRATGPSGGLNQPRHGPRTGRPPRTGFVCWKAMSASPFSPRTAGGQRPLLSISQLNELLRETIQAVFPSVWVSGEISDLTRPQSGHVYLTLKDDQSQLRAVIWRGTARSLRFDLQDGMQVVCEGAVDIYPPRGTYQLVIRQLEPRGVGALQLALSQLRERLTAEGLFDVRHKRPLPRFPRRIAVITSPTGAAIRDFLEVVRQRWHGSHVLLIPTRVQGAEATDEIIQALRLAQRLRPRPDVIVLTRGGGSLEDLWCFNEERLVREIHAAQIPLISAIGHEIDVTLADLVADVPRPDAHRGGCAGRAVPAGSHAGA